MSQYYSVKCPMRAIISLLLSTRRLLHRRGRGGDWLNRSHMRQKQCAVGDFPMSCRNAAARHRVYRGTHNKDTRFRMKQTLHANILRQSVRYAQQKALRHPQCKGNRHELFSATWSIHQERSRHHLCRSNPSHAPLGRTMHSSWALASPKNRRNQLFLRSLQRPHHRTNTATFAVSGLKVYSYKIFHTQSAFPV